MEIVDGFELHWVAPTSDRQPARGSRKPVSTCVLAIDPRIGELCANRREAFQDEFQTTEIIPVVVPTPPPTDDDGQLIA